MLIYSKPPTRRLTLSDNLVAVLVAVTFLGCDQANNVYEAPPPPEVTYARPIETPITPFVDEIGITEAASEAEVQSRVRGFLQSVEFQPGDPVKQGEILYKIEPDQYQAAFEAAKAAVENATASIAVTDAEVKIAESDLLKATQDMDREERLKQQNASSQAQYDAAVAMLAAARASLESSKANVQSATAKKLQAEATLVQAELDLQYTDVLAEIDGAITKTNFKLGNLVENGSQLATIVNDARIFANFSISDSAALRLRRARKASGRIEPDEAAEWRGAPVYLAREGDRGYPFEGELDYIDPSGVDADTGTLGIRAVFDNADGDLFPGLFVSVRVPAAEAVTSLVIPERALQRDQQGPFVLTIDQDNNVGRARVDVGQTVGGWAIILDGINPESRVVIDGLQFARQGATVVPVEATFNVDPLMLLRGLSDPDRAGETAPTSDATPGASDGSATSDSSDAP